MSKALDCCMYGTSIKIFAKKWSDSLLGICLVLALLLPACTSPETEAPLRIGTNNWPGYEPLSLETFLANFFSDPDYRYTKYSRNIAA